MFFFIIVRIVCVLVSMIILPPNITYLGKNTSLFIYLFCVYKMHSFEIYDFDKQAMSDT